MEGYPALLAVIAQEAARELAAIGTRADAERDRILADARKAAEAARAARLAAARREAGVARAAAVGAAAVERERAVFLEQRKLLDALRDRVAAQLTAVADPGLPARLLPELLAEAGDGPFTIRCDPGDEDAVARALPPDVRARARIAPAPARRGGLELEAGRRVLDDTLAARLARVWAAAEPEAAARLFGDGTWRASTS